MAFAIVSGIVDTFLVCWSQDSSGLQQLLQQQCSRQQQQLYEGLAAVLLGAEEADDLVAALEEKYDVMRDKLLLEVPLPSPHPPTGCLFPLPGETTSGYVF